MANRSSKHKLRRDVNARAHAIVSPPSGFSLLLPIIPKAVF
jgi:hypothetical protein